MPEKRLEHKDIIELLDKLREETPEYPAHLVEARKESFLKQVLDLSVSGSGQDKDGGQEGGDKGPKGGSGGPGRSGGPGKSGKAGKPGSSSSSGGSSRPGGSSGSGGSSAGLFRGTMGLGLGISPKAVFIFGAIVFLLTTAYFFRNQIAEVLAENSIIRLEETAAPSLVSSANQATETPVANFQIAPVAETPAPGSAGTGTASDSGGSGSVNNNNGGIPITGEGVEPANPTPTQAVNQKVITPTPQQSPDNSISGRLQFLLCVLQSGQENCR